MNKNIKGFTIVELLIIVVVIGVLAAITIASFNGVQGRAYDAIVKGDLNSLAKKVELYRVDNGRYPPSNDASDQEFALTSLKFKANGQAYTSLTTSIQTSRNLVYCTNPSTDAYAVAAKSRSGNAYYIVTNNTSPRPFTENWTVDTDAGTICTTPSIGLYAAIDYQSAGYYLPTETSPGVPGYGWWAWTGVAN